MNEVLFAGWLPAMLSSLVLSGCTDETTEVDDPSAYRDLEDGLLLHWTFEASSGSQITDLSGNGRHGTLQGGAALVTSPIGQAVSLDGVNDYISFAGPRSPALFGGADGSFTFTARVRVSDVAKYNTLCFGCGPFATMYTGTVDYGAVAMAALDDQASTAKKWAKSGAKLLPDQWTQVTLVVENGGSARYYLDCTLDTTMNDANIGLEDPGSSSVGWSSNASRWFQGEIDELRVWDRALSETELAQLCPAPPEPGPLEANLEMHWTFEDHTGNQVLDMSGNGRNGTVVGATFVDSPDGQALSLDGIDDKVSFVGPRALSIYGGATGDFTISATARVADIAKYNTLCFGCGPFSNMYLGNPAPNPGKLWASVWNLDSNTSVWANSNQALTNDEWAEVTLVVEGGSEARWYKDCTFQSAYQGNVGLRDPGYSALGESSNASRWFKGEVDELRVWSRALSEAELSFLCPAPPCDTPIHVDVDAPDGGDGLSWATAFNTVQDGIDAAAAATCADPQVWLAEGNYVADAPNERVAIIESPMAIYGGFSGVETSLDQRDFVAHPVRLGADGWQTSVVRIDQGAAPEFKSVRLDGVRISGGTQGAIEVNLAYAELGTVYLENLTITDNSDPNGGGGLELGSGRVELSNSSFEGNSTTLSGGAISMGWGTLIISNTNFVDNQANLGGAIFADDPLIDIQLSDSNFTSNTASWGGAIFIDDNPANPEYAQLTVVGGEFDGNTASKGGGAIYLEESSSSFDGVVFTGNSGIYGGAIQLANVDANVVSEQLEIRDCRFIGNHATAGNGGALRLQDSNTTVINTEFVGNTATTVGGAVWGRGTFVSSTFTNNTATNSGSALYAAAGADMYMHHCVAYPDTVVGQNIYAPYSCMKSNVLGSPKVVLGNTNPFAPADLDSDGRTEYYLLPGSLCTGLEGGVITEFEWDELTVDASQCTDSGWPDPGVHYTPQSAVGACP